MGHIMTHIRDIDLYMPAANGFGLYAGSATIEIDPDGRMIGLTTIVELGTGRSAQGREINCLLGSDFQRFEDKPIAAHVEALAANWLTSDDGQDWIKSLVLTRSERRDMALENAHDVAREAA